MICTCFLCQLHISEIDSGKSPDVLNAMKDAIRTTNGSVVTYTCDQRYEVGVVSIASECNDSKQWNPNYLICAGKNNQYLYDYNALIEFKYNLYFLQHFSIVNELIITMHSTLLTCKYVIS